MRRFAFPVVLEGGALGNSGNGTLLTTRSCLLTPTRNPQLSVPDYEALLRAALSVTRVVRFEGGPVGDHTDSHIDTIVRFTDDRTIVTCDAPTPPTPTTR